MEAQYALQKKKVLIPLMLTQGYEADGWLGLLLGTSMWYGFYGETLSSESGFATRMDALCREIGVRGRADAVASADDSPACPSNFSPLASELMATKMSALRKRAMSYGVSEEALEEADDAEDTKAELIKLILAHEQPADESGSDAVRAELLATKTSLLRKKAIAAGVALEAIEAADDAADMKAALVELLMASQPGGHGESA
jgi:hypothetical protein